MRFSIVLVAVLLAGSTTAFASNDSDDANTSNDEFEDDRYEVSLNFEIGTAVILIPIMLAAL